MSDCYDFRGAGTGSAAQWLGAALIAAIFVKAIISLLSMPQLLRLLAPALCLLTAAAAYLLFIRGLEMQAHRMLAVCGGFVPALLMGSIFSRGTSIKSGVVWPAVAVLATLFTLVAPLRLVAEMTSGFIHAGRPERELGDKMLKSLPDESKVFIDVPDDVELFHSHYMYLECVRALGDEKRVIFPQIRFTYLQACPRLRDVDATQATHFLRRRHRPGRLKGAFHVISFNSRYEVCVPGQGTLIHAVGRGFHPSETVEGRRGRWLRQNGEILFWTRAGRDVTVRARILPNPLLPDAHVTTVLNGEETGPPHAAAGGLLDLTLRLKPGRNLLLLKSSLEPVAPSAEDTRRLSVYFEELTITARGNDSARK